MTHDNDSLHQTLSEIQTVVLALRIQSLVNLLFFYLISSEKSVYPIKICTETDWLVDTTVKYYTLSPNSSYHYEFRYHFLSNTAPQRLIFFWVVISVNVSIGSCFLQEGVF